LSQASTKLGEAVHKATQAQAGGAGDQAATTKGDDKVVDAEFEEVNEQKRSQG
jgi:molecular chaperone DnaK